MRSSGTSGALPAYAMRQRWTIFSIRLTGAPVSCEKAAILLHGIAIGHPFIDGNKRTAFVAADNMIRGEDHQINASDDEVVSFMLEVAEYRHTRESVEAWIKERTGL
jgi:death-on-curing protein